MIAATFEKIAGPLSLCALGLPVHDGELKKAVEDKKLQHTGHS
jgi:hypothetical protein